MAELPEVESIRRALAAEITGVRWGTVSVKPGRIFRTPAVALAKSLRGSRVEAVRRRGKVILFDFDNDLVLLVHLGMSGQILLHPPSDPGPDHRHLTVGLEDGRALVFRDPRRFGFFRLARKEDVPGLRELAGVGIDPLDSALTWEKFNAMLKSRTTKVKALLMDQRVMAGIGNIYADEILHHARISPHRQASDLSPIEMKELYHAIRTVLSGATERGGTSFDAAFTDIYGRPGLYGGSLKVYERGDEPCPRCNTGLKSARVAGRSSVFCPHCQK
jgi:formamidopyrimidine-DNA glycosylase